MQSNKNYKYAIRFSAFFNADNNILNLHDIEVDIGVILCNSDNLYLEAKEELEIIKNYFLNEADSLIIPKFNFYYKDNIEPKILEIDISSLKYKDYTFIDYKFNKLKGCYMILSKITYIDDSTIFYSYTNSYSTPSYIKFDDIKPKMLEKFIINGNYYSKEEWLKIPEVIQNLRCKKLNQMKNV